MYIPSDPNCEVVGLIPIVKRHIDKDTYDVTHHVLAHSSIANCMYANHGNFLSPHQVPRAEIDDDWGHNSSYPTIPYIPNLHPLISGLIWSLTQRDLMLVTLYFPINL